jgi:hypothetical protein
MIYTANNCETSNTVSFSILSDIPSLVCHVYVGMCDLGASLVLFVLAPQKRAWRYGAALAHRLVGAPGKAGATSADYIAI